MTSIDEKVFDRATMAKEVSSYGKWSLGWGAVNLVFSGLSSPFGLVLLVLGLASFYFNLASMFIVYGIVFLWAAISNLFVGGGLASFFTIVLALSAVQAFRNYARYRPVETALLTGDDGAEIAEADTGDSGPRVSARTAQILPWSSFLIAIASLGGLLTSFVIGSIWLVATGNEELPALIFFVAAASLQFGILALSLGVASILSGYRYKVLSAIGILGGTVALVIELVLVTIA